MTLCQVFGIPVLSGIRFLMPSSWVFGSTINRHNRLTPLPRASPSLTLDDQLIASTWTGKKRSQLGEQLDKDLMQVSGTLALSCAASVDPTPNPAGSKRHDDSIQTVTRATEGVLSSAKEISNNVRNVTEIDRFHSEDRG